MTPRYLQSQIDQSLRNMNLSTIDVYYIHNPESQLGAVRREEFDGRLRAAFELLQSNISEGKIRMYGVATWNGFRVPADAREYHSLERMVEIARSVGGTSHGFRFIQLPFNLAMPEALMARNQQLEGEQVSTLEAAGALGVTAVASASLLQGKVARGLPEHIREPLGSLATDAQTAIQFVRSAPGVATALVGMSRREHVEENLQLARVAPTLPEDFLRLFAENEE
jgi:aryl-alcohol dehydrogenase-like predicted oxidoreductase